MRKLVNICLIISVFAVPASLSAKVKIKVVEKSSRKVPTWVGGSPAGYIVTSATSPDLETARNQCMENVRTYIIQSVAENVEVESQSTINQTSTNGDITDFADQFTSTYRAKGADVPFLRGVSTSKIEESYWEKRQNKSTKETYYVYSIKYPFPSVELKKLVHEFEQRDREIYGKYVSLAADFDDVTSLEQIDRAIADLGPVIDYLFDSTRKRQAEALRESYRKLYPNITFRPVKQMLGEYRFQLVLDGRPISTSQRVDLKSDCATQLTSEIEGDHIVVRYSYDGCRYDDQNSITASVRIAGRSVPHTFYFTIKKYDVEIWPEKTVYLTANNRGEGEVSDIDIRMTVKSGHEGSYTIKALTLEVPGLREPLFLDNLNSTFGKGESTINLTWIGTAAVVWAQNNRLNMLSGNMEVEIPDEGISKRVEFSVPFRPNW